ncbi:hypothetical protein ACQP1P_35355 [Dactylosporangium sp. CA-052675]|uniref:hypothetical protein n=1 Tax=Dactylosporangium sp. CA-052675 TaxID=3239927 RepID=UPI003D94287C
MSGDDSDEAYVIGLCSKVLGEPAKTQHRFEWLLGDPSRDGRRVMLPVGGYWPGHQLVVVYDARRDTEIPAHGLRLVTIRPADLDCESRGRLRRNVASDLQAIRRLLVPSSDEDWVTEAFRNWLLAEGWTPVTPTDPWADVEAVRGAQRLIGEVKGTTSEPGTDADIAYGQLLRRMTGETDAVRYALIVPTGAVNAVRRVPARIRDQLRIDLYEVTARGEVRQVS